MTKPTVAVIGAGIVGATIAHFLARAGARVILADALKAPGLGVTGRSFGWINAVTFDPASDPRMFRLRRDAIGRYRRLDAELGGQLIAEQSGSLLWKGSPAETVRWIETHRAAGNPLRLVDAAEFARLAPAFAEPPEAAVHAADEFAINPDMAAGLYVRLLRQAGGEALLGQAVEAVAFSGGRTHGIRIGGGTIPADHVVVAAGAATSRLLDGMLPPVDVSPSALIELVAGPLALDCVVSGPQLEIRRSGRDRCLITKSVTGHSGEDIEKTLAEMALMRARQLLPPLRNALVRSVGIGYRPMPDTGGIMVGSPEGCDNLLVAVGHPGVILAPAIAEAVVNRITGGPAVADIPAGTICDRSRERK